MISDGTSSWALDCGCRGTLAPNEVTDPCERHAHRRGSGFTGNQPPTQMDGPAPRPEGSAKQHESYFVLSAAERQKGFVRPVRRTYVHTLCGSFTSMGDELAQTYAREPGFYGATFCVNCGAHFPVGQDGEFVWGDGSKVGT